MGFELFIGIVRRLTGAWALLVFLSCAPAGVSRHPRFWAQLPVASDWGLLAVLACVIGVVGARRYHLAQAPGPGS